MCTQVCIKGNWCETVGELRRQVPEATIIKEACYRDMPDDDSCLCGIDIPATLNTAGMASEVDESGDYHA